MNRHFFIKDNFVHLWRAKLSDFNAKQDYLVSLLSPDEVKRAERLRFAVHKERFIIARGLLRKILGLYVDTPPVDIQFNYGKHGKPYLVNQPIQFNVSHSHDMAVYALTMRHEIGIDIEKVENHFKMDIAERFFNKEEFLELMHLPEVERPQAFYRMWAHKEAIIKLLGLGLYANISENHNNPYLVHSFTIHPDYEAAFAIQSPFEQVLFWEWSADFTPIQLLVS